MASTPSPARAFGRALADFGPLSPAETAVLAAARMGEFADFGSGVPPAATPANRLRAGVVRYLALGGCTAAAVHERGVQIRGAWIDGGLDLDAAQVTGPLRLHGCRIEQFSAFDARFGMLDLRGSALPGGLKADRMRCAGLRLSRVRATGEVRFFDADIAGNVECDDATLENEGGVALGFDGAHIASTLFVRQSRVQGSIRFVAAKIDESATFNGLVVQNGGAQAIAADRATIGGGIHLTDGFAATGGVQLRGIRIVAGLYCENGTFDCPRGYALDLEGATIGGRFGFSGVAAVSGQVDLRAAAVGGLDDDIDSWPGAGSLRLDGFVYTRFAGRAPTDAASRIAWLERQPADDLGASFKPQPWEQLIAILRAMGHPAAAREVAIAKQERLRTAGRLTGMRAAVHRQYGLLVGYGYKPERLARAMIGVWLGMTLVFWAAVNPGTWFGAQTYLMAPARMPTDAACLAARAAARSGDPCPAPPPDYRSFFAPAYSLDVLLPVVNLGYKAEWKPVVSDAAGNPLWAGHALRLLVWAEIIFGWVAGLILVGVVGNLIKKD